MRLFLLSIIIGLSSGKAYGQKFEELNDYVSLDHEIQIKDLRAGNHDESGVNEYYFQVSIYGLAILKEERKKAFKDRKKVTRLMGTFGEQSVKSLDFATPSNPPQSFRISGEDVRSLVSEAMMNLEVSESQVAVFCKIQLYEKNKQFIFFGEDTLVGSTSYFIVPESIPHKPVIKDAVLEISDILGSHARLQTRYDLLDPKKKKRKK